MILLLLQSLLFSLFLSAVPPRLAASAYSKEIIVAESNFGKITFNDFKNWIETKNLPQSILTDVKKSRRILNLMLEELVSLEDAKEKRVIQPVNISLGIEEIRKPVINAFSPFITDQEIKDYYNTHLPFFYRLPQRRICHILVNNESELKTLIQSFNSLLKENINPQECMILLADKSSQKEPSSKRWGDLGWVSKGKFPKEFDKYIFSLKYNGDYATFSSPLGYHFVINMHTREPKTYTLDETRKYIKKKLQAQKKDEFWRNYVEGLKRKYNIRFYSDNLAKINLEEEQKINMAFIHGGEFYAGFDENGVKERCKLWERYVKPFVNQKYPGWIGYIHQTYHAANIKSFYIDKYEVAYSDYKEFLEDTGYRPLPGWIEEFIVRDDYPIVGVSWYDADAYCRWKRKRLPTQDEWEFAARGNMRRKYPWGNKTPDGKRGNFADINSDAPWKNTRYNDGYKYLAPVNSYPKGATPEGVYNLGGNVREWTATVNNKNGTSITKGGSFRNAFDDMLSADQRPYKLNATDYTLGFRCACNAEI